MEPPASTPPSAAFDALYEQIERLPEGVTGEILRPGALTTMARPGPSHRYTAKHIDDDLRDRDATRGGHDWWIETEAEIRFGADRLAVPDLAGWRVERVAQRPRSNPITVRPDWCAEVLSETTARRDRFDKLPLYMATGVGHVWLVDPDAHTIEVFARDGDRIALVVTATDADVVVLPPFAERAFDLSRWWDPGE